MYANEYYSKFLELIRFTPEIVPSKTLKAQRFEQGLNLTLQSKLLGGVTFETLDEIYGRFHRIKGRELEGTSSGEKRTYNCNGNQ